MHRLPGASRLPGVTRRSNRLRNVFIAFCAVGIAIVGLVFVAQNFLGPARYRAIVIGQVEAATGLPCTVEDAALSILPSPQLLISGLHAGNDAIKIDIGSITAKINGTALLKGQIEVPELIVDGLEAVLPEEFTGFESGGNQDNPAAVTTAASAGPGAHVISVSVPNWRVRRGDKLVAQGDIHVLDPLGDNAVFNGVAQIPGISPDATAKVDGTIQRGGGNFALEGKATLNNADLAQAAGRDEIKSAVLNAELGFNGTSPDDIAFTLDGALSASGAASLAGKVSGKAWWKDGEFTANDFTWDSPGLHVLADASRKAAGDVAVNVREAEAEKEGLALLLGLASTKNARISARKEAKLAIKDLLVGRAADGQLRWVRGDANLSGLDVDGASGPLVDNLKAKCRLDEGTLHITEATTNGLSVNGDLIPTEKGGITFNLAGSGDFGSPVIAAALPSSIAGGAKGKLTIKRASGTWTPGGALPANLAVEGGLENGTLQLKTDRFNDKISNLAVNFATDGKVVYAKAVADSETMGDLKFDGSHDTATQATQGTVTFSLNRLAAAFVPASSGADVARAMLAAYDGATYNISFKPPTSANDPGEFTLENKAVPPAKVVATLLLDPRNGVTPGAIKANFEVPFAPAAAALPQPATGEGTAAVVFERTAAGRFTGTADLTSTSLSVPPYLNKRAGQAVRLDVAGNAGDTWAMESLTLDLLGQTIALTPKGDGLVAPDLQVDLARLAPLFPEGSEASGGVSGSIGVAPVYANLRLTAVRVKTPSGLAIDEINGGLAYGTGSFRCEALHVMAYGSDFIVDGASNGSQWNGSLKGARADLNTLAAIRGVSSGTSATGSAPGGSGSAAGPSGTVEVALDEVVFRKATVDNFRAQVRFSPEEFVVDQITCAPYGGTANGNFTLNTPGGGTTGTAITHLSFNGVDLKILDDLSTLSDPRGMYGPATGAIDLSFPYSPTGNPALGVDGEVKVTAENGSLGKAGASGKVLAALRTAELAQLQIPSLRDKGLSFETMSTRVICNKGVLTLDHFDVTESTHTMSATGIIDFPSDAIDVTLRIQLLQNVRNVLGAIPLLDRLAEAGGIYIYFTGSALDPKVSAARIRPLQEIRQQGGGLINGVRGLLGR